MTAGETRNSTVRPQPGRPPRAIRGFEHINRYWDPTEGIFAAKLLPGEYYVTDSGELLTTVLGSCVAVCMRDRNSGVGGMNHFMLPSEGDRQDGVARPGTLDSGVWYGSAAIEQLVNALLKLGAARENLEAKVVGGGSLLELSLRIGDRNAEFATEFLQREGIPLVGFDVGGRHPRKVRYYPASGRAMVKKLLGLRNDTIEQREKRYGRDLAIAPATSDVELF